jgi:hypothetical protein
MNSSTNPNPTTSLNPTTVILNECKGSVFQLSQSSVRAVRFFASAQNDVGGNKGHGIDVCGVEVNA